MRQVHLCIRLPLHPVPSGRLVQVIWDRYVRAMQEARFTESVGVYIASGLLTYGANEGDNVLPSGSWHGVLKSAQFPFLGCAPT